MSQPSGRERTQKMTSENYTDYHVEHPRTPQDKIFDVLAAIALVIIIAILFSGCIYNRNAPLINVQDSANGNTVPVSAVP
jgi:hypothetical protein